VFDEYESVWDPNFGVKINGSNGIINELWHTTGNILNKSFQQAQIQPFKVLKLRENSLES